MDELLRQLVDGQKEIIGRLDSQGKAITSMQIDLSGLKSDVSGLKSDVSELKSDVSGLKADVSELKSDVSGLKADVSELKSDVSGLKSDVSDLKSDMADVKGQLEENTSILRALEHQSQVQKAELSNLIITTARLEGEVKGLRSDINAIEAITAKNWTDIVQLKAVK
jgi:chromosome segregation ATPase